MTNAPPDHTASAISRYRAYLIGQNGKIDHAIEIMADTGEGAIAQVRELTRTYEVELWDRSRVVIRLATMTSR